MRSSFLMCCPFMQKMPNGRCCTAGPAGSLGMRSRPEMVGMESVIGDQNHRRFRPGESQQRFEHHVVEAIGAINDIFVDFEAALQECPPCAVDGSA